MGLALSWIFRSAQVCIRLDLREPSLKRVFFKQSFTFYFFTFQRPQALRRIFSPVQVRRHTTNTDRESQARADCSALYNAAQWKCPLHLIIYSKSRSLYYNESGGPTAIFKPHVLANYKDYRTFTQVRCTLHSPSYPICSIHCIISFNLQSMCGEERNAPNYALGYCLWGVQRYEQLMDGSPRVILCI